ncbi:MULTISPECIES: ABC transporter permease [Pseudomonas]|uniref:ABC transporter permease n=1 Tax=Pseudomonas TaxID=286 RepID=UPI001B33EFF8|nr:MULTISPECIES: ABC transporter permease [Pseudomonas]MBP5945322.1 ABC transporter permease [Pseudomonas sp. P9(2020)]MBP5955748.1 ABC transporter permease [Pseudomonas anatoliensis]MBZ9563804.1 ABC transporter permease [Pseudomonas sp. P116]
MRIFPATPVEMVASLWRHRALIHASAKREVLGRYRGSMLGLLWSFFNPLLMLLVYTFVFSVVFKARWGTGGEGSKIEFALVLFAGLIVFNLFAECVNRAPSLILSNANYVKKVVYPLEILPFVGLLAAFYHAAISVTVWLVAYALLIGAPMITALYLPLVLIPFALFIMGLCWTLASLGVFLRDVSQLIAVVTSVLMFLSPIFYPASALPDEYQHILYYNPLVPVIEMVRDILYWGKSPDLNALAIYTLAAAVIAWLGFALFQKTRKGFADVL